MNQTHQPSKVPPLASDEKTEVALQKGMKLKKFPNSSEKSLSLCHYEPCLIALNFINGKHICPRCRRGFCHFHWKTGEFQIKISVDGKYDPIYGTFKSVCYPCFKDRPW